MATNKETKVETEVKAEDNFAKGSKYKVKAPFSWGSGVIDDNFLGLDEMAEWFKKGGSSEFSEEQQDYHKRIFKENFELVK